jgi:beta-N-acetylhexosaminidase
MHPIGPIMLDLAGTELSSEERNMLQHPLVGGVILFTRNYVSPEQITVLCQTIRQAREWPLLIAVDHEGGRVQRFREGFTILPSMGSLGQLYEKSPQEALKLAESYGKTIATELMAVGIDLSFTPVLDLNKGICPAIGDRAFSKQSAVVVKLAKALMHGMHGVGMAATGKHFPGHGAVNVDSHLGLPIDTRSFAEIEQEDLIPFVELIRGGIDALMPAHILFPAIDDKPVGFSRHWLHDILRKQLQFTGVIFSDDLNMAGADIAGDYADRAKAALEAGCDMALICNNRSGAIQILDGLPQRYFLEPRKFQSLKKQVACI